MLMIRNHAAVPDSMLNYFAGMDDYRYSLYNDLEEIDQLKFFPARFSDQVDLAKSKLLSSKPYGRPDSVVYIDKLTAEFKSRRGYIYFFKYRDKKDDPVWKLATVGLLSKDPKQFEIKNSTAPMFGNYGNDEADVYDFTSFTDVKLVIDEPVKQQLNKELKKILYSHRKSAKQFYDLSRSSDDVYALKYRN